MLLFLNGDMPRAIKIVSIVDRAVKLTILIIVFIDERGDQSASRIDDFATIWLCIIRRREISVPTVKCFNWQSAAADNVMMPFLFLSVSIKMYYRYQRCAVNESYIALDGMPSKVRQIRDLFTLKMYAIY